LSTDRPLDEERNLSDERTPQERVQADKRAWLFSQALVGLLLLAVFALLPLVASRLRGGSAPTPPTATSDGNEGQTGKPVNDLAQTSGLAPITKEERQAASAQVQRLVLMIEAAKLEMQLKTLAERMHEWKRLLGTTLQNDAGRRIAAVPFSLDQFILSEQLYNAVGTPSDISKLEAQLHRNVQLARDENDPDQLKSITEALSSGNERAMLWRHEYVRRHQVLVQLVDSAASHPTADLTLETALAQRASSLEATKSDRIQIAVEEEKQRLTREHQSIQEDIQTQQKLLTGLKSQLSAVRAGDQTNTNLASPNSSPPASLEEYRADLPRIRSLLQPFISPGYMQPKSADELTHTAEKSAMSYAALVQTGALGGEEGLQALLRVGGSKSARQNNDRPLGQFPRMNSVKDLEDDRVRMLLEESQRLLLDHGQRMIDEGLLLP